MTPWKWVQEKGTWASAKASYKGAKPNVDPLVRHLGTLLEGDAGFLLDICRRAGVHRQTLRRWLAGERTPNLADFRAVLQVTGHTLTIQRIPHEDHQ